MSLIQHASIPTNTGSRKEEHETNAKKRTSDEAEEVELDRRPFSIRPDSTDPFAAPQTFTPICLLSRARIPLAYLDITTNSNRLFSAHIAVLSILNSDGDETNVLIAEDEKEKRLYAIERAGRRTYALCRLGQSVKQMELEARAAIVVQQYEQQAKRQAVQPVENVKPWWSKAAVHMPSQESDNAASNDVPQLSMLLTPASTSTGTDPDLLPTEQTAKAALGPASEPHPAGMPAQRKAEPVVAKTCESVLEDLAKHYMDALYLSRTSLAYFAKGPLSRARAAFTAESEDGFEASGLITALRDAVLTASAMDKKFKDAVVTAITELSPLGLETPEKLPKKRKRKWKAKRDKAGFWVEEKEHLEKWWREHDDTHVAPGSMETIDDGLRRRIPRLRSRETYLQIMLALEILALEKAHPPTANGKDAPEPDAAESQQQETQAVESQPATDAKKPRAKKPQDLPALLDTLLDRLCIWHSLDSHSPAKKHGEESQQEESNDELKSFCVEVIIPFYMSRIPEHAISVNKKLGGPSAPTPVKRKSTLSRKPGEPTMRQPPEKKPRKPLSRVVSEAMANAKHPPALHRSATDSDILEQQIKREGSQTPDLDCIPHAKVPQPRKRTSLMHSLSFSRREVDLSAVSQANEAKMRKKADVDTKLRDALDALKKPNRSLALKEVAAKTDETFAKATARSSRPAAKRRPSARDAAHVTATPAHRRTAKATPGRALHAPRQVGSGSSGATFVPSSSARLLARPHDHAEPPTSSFAIPQTGHRPRLTAAPLGVEETPSRGFAKFMPAGLTRQPGNSMESPIAARHRQAPAQIEQTPVKPMRPLSLAPPEPLIEASPNAVRIASPLKQRPEVQDGQQGVKSIYDTLGWDEEPYEDLA